MHDQPVFVHPGAHRNESVCSHMCDLLCPRMLPPPNHTHSLSPSHSHTHMHARTHTYSNLDRPGCQSYTNSHPLAAGFQDNHGNQSLTPEETSSRTERLHSISTSQYSTHKRTHMHSFSHTNTHSPTGTLAHIRADTQTWTRPTQPTCSNSLAVTPAFPACLHWGEWELVRETAHYILSPTVLNCTYTAHEWNNYTSLMVIRHTVRGRWQTLLYAQWWSFSTPEA